MLTEYVWILPKPAGAGDAMPHRTGRFLQHVRLRTYCLQHFPPAMLRSIKKTRDNCL